MRRHRLAGIGLAIVAEVSIAQGSEPPLECLRVGIALGGLASGMPLDAELVIAEADGIWRRHGVMVVHLLDELSRVEVRLNVMVRSRNVAVGGGRTGQRVFADRLPDDFAASADSPDATLVDRLDASAYRDDILRLLFCAAIPICRGAADRVGPSHRFRTLILRNRAGVPHQREGRGGRLSIAGWPLVAGVA